MNEKSVASVALLLVASTVILPGCTNKTSIALPPSKTGGSTSDAATGGAVGQPTETSGQSTGGGDTSAGATAGGPLTAEHGIDSSQPPVVAEGANKDPNAKSVTLRLNLDKGSEFKYSNETESTQSFGGDGKAPQPTTMKSSSDTLVKVLSKDGDKARVQMSVSNSKMTGGPDDAQGKKMMEEMAKAVNGVVVSASFSPTGLPTDVKYEKGNKMAAMSAGVDSDTGFFGMTYPETPVKAGDTWNHKFDFKTAAGPVGLMPGATWKDSDLTTVFMLSSIDEKVGIAVVSIRLAGTPSVIMKAPPAPGSKEPPKGAKDMELRFSVAGSGSATVDLKSGTPKTLNYRMKVDFTGPMGKVTQESVSKLSRK